MHTRPRDPKYLLILSIASVVILVGGWLIRPRATPQAPVALPTEADLTQLARRAERRSLESMAGYFAGVVSDVAASLVRVPDLHASGIVWAAGDLVTARLPLAVPPAPISVRMQNENREATAVRWGPNLPFARLSARAGDQWNPVISAAGVPAYGEWVVAVWRNAEAPVFSAGHYIERAPLDCGLVTAHEIASSILLTATMAGGGLFNLDGQLLGVIVPCGDRLAVLAATSIADLLARDATIAQTIHERYGLAVSMRQPEEARYFDEADGIVVREVRQRQAGDRAGFHAGDLIVGVNANGVASVDDLAPVLSAADVTVRRGSRRVLLALPPRAGSADGEAPPADAGIVLKSAPRGFAIHEVAPASRAARAGLEPGDRIIRIDYTEPRSVADLEQRLRARANAPVLIEVERGDRRVARWMPPEDARE